MLVDEMFPMLPLMPTLLRIRALSISCRILQESYNKWLKSHSVPNLTSSPSTNLRGGRNFQESVCVTNESKVLKDQQKKVLKTLRSASNMASFFLGGGPCGMSFCLNSLKGGYIGESKGGYYRVY